MSLALSPPGWTNSGLDVRDVRGRTEPRLFTPPLRELTPETSYGFDVIDFSRDILMHPLDPWQERAAIRGGEHVALGRLREERRAADGAERAHGRIHATGNELLGAGEEGFRKRHG